MMSSGIFVEGLVTDGLPDLHGQIVDAELAARELTDWYESGGRVGQLHSERMPAAGRAVAFEVRPDGVWVRAHIVEPDAVRLVNEGFYRGFSVGIVCAIVVDDPSAPAGRIVDALALDVDLVDRPANPRARFVVVSHGSPAEMDAALALLPSPVEISMDAALALIPGGN